MNLPAALPRIVRAKLPLRPMHVWTIRVRLQIERRVRDLALFDIALDSKLRGCDVVALAFLHPRANRRDGWKADNSSP